MLDSVRQVAPHLKEQIKTGRFREMIGRRKEDIGIEVKMIVDCLERRYPEGAMIGKFHISGGFREGQTDSTSGIVGISWDKFKGEFSRVDDYESKVRQGITWRDCPVDTFFPDLPNELKQVWTDRGKPMTEKLLVRGYKELTARSTNAFAKS